MAYAVGLRTPPDAARHYSGLKVKRTQGLHSDILNACAYAEYAESKSHTFESGEVDLDTGSSCADRTVDNQTTFKGRFFVAKDRRTRRLSWQALPDRTATKGKKNLTPETKKECGPAYDKIKDGAFPMSDGSPALVALGKDRGFPGASVCHGKQQYVKPVKMLLSKMSPQAKAAAKKRPGSIKGNYYYALAGDNAAESVFGTAQQSRARMNLVGRASGARAHVNQLAAYYLVRKPGLASVLNALKKYRLYAEDNLAPADAYGKSKKTPWLGVSQEAASASDSDESESEE